MPSAGPLRTADRGSHAAGIKAKASIGDWQCAERVLIKVSAGGILPRLCQLSTDKDSPTQRQNFSGTLREGMGLAAAV